MTLRRLTTAHRNLIRAAKAEAGLPALHAAAAELIAAVEAVSKESPAQQERKTA